MITTHRLIWRNKSIISSDLVLPLHYVIFIEEEGGGGFTRSDKIVLHLAAPPPSKYFYTIVLVSSLVIYQILIILHRSSKRPKSTKSVQLRQIGLQIRRNEKFHGFFTRISWFEKMASSCKSKRCVSKIVPDCFIILQL